MLRASLAWFAASALGLAAQEPAPPPRTVDPIEPAAFAAWREHLAPTAAEDDWAALPWLPTFSVGLATARQQHRPLLLWVMNGHPLGCT